jgi:hypothetical protein
MRQARRDRGIHAARPSESNADRLRWRQGMGWIVAGLERGGKRISAGKR